jgi:hypothetical protein
MFHGSAIANAENIARHEAQRFSRRGDAEIFALMRSGIEEGRGRQVAAPQRGLDGDRKIGNPLSRAAKNPTEACFGLTPAAGFGAAALI